MLLILLLVRKLSYRSRESGPVPLLLKLIYCVNNLNYAFYYIYNLDLIKLNLSSNK